MQDPALAAMEDMVDDKTQPDDEKTPGEPTKPVEEPQRQTDKPKGPEPAKEPEKPEEPSTEDPAVPREDLDEIFAMYNEEVVEEPPPTLAHEPESEQRHTQQQTQYRQQETMPIPQDILAITPQKFMPAGQEYDPMDANNLGSPSHHAMLSAEQERHIRFSAGERERVRQEEIARQGSKAIARLRSRMEREKWPQLMQDEFWNTPPDHPDTLDRLADGFLISKRKALRKAQGAQQAGDGGEPPPVSKATRQIEKPRSSDETDKEVNRLFGPKREVAI